MDNQPELSPLRVYFYSEKGGTRSAGLGMTWLDNCSTCARRETGFYLKVPSSSSGGWTDPSPSPLRSLLDGPSMTTKSAVASAAGLSARTNVLSSHPSSTYASATRKTFLPSTLSTRASNTTDAGGTMGARKSTVRFAVKDRWYPAYHARFPIAVSNNVLVSPPWRNPGTPSVPGAPISATRQHVALLPASPSATNRRYESFSGPSPRKKLRDAPQSSYATSRAPSGTYACLACLKAVAATAMERRRGCGNHRAARVRSGGATAIGRGLWVFGFWGALARPGG